MHPCSRLAALHGSPRTQVMSWSCDWKLCFNASKCKIMHIGRKNIGRTYRLASVQGIHDLAEIDNVCDVGVNLQSNFIIIIKINR